AQELSCNHSASSPGRLISWLPPTRPCPSLFQVTASLLFVALLELLQRVHLSQFIEGSTPQTLRQRRPLEAIPPFSFSIWLERVLRIVLTPLFRYRSPWIAYPNEPPCDFSVALAHGFPSSKIVGTTRAVVLHQSPRDIRADQFRDRSVAALGDGFQHLSVLVV